MGTCRVCLADGADVSLFDREDDVKPYVKVMACSSVQICKEDGFPSNICVACLLMLDTAFEFKQKCESSDLKLRSYAPADRLKVERVDDDDADEDFVPPDDDGDAYPDDFDGTSDVDVKPVVFDAVANDNDDEPLIKIKRGALATTTRKKKKWKSLKQRANATRKAKKSGEAKIRRIVSNSIATSLLEGKCVWNGSEWRFETAQREDTIKKEEEIATIKKEKEEELARVKQRRREKRRQAKKLEALAVNLCDACGKTFKSKYHLKHHIFTKHPEEEGGGGGVVLDCPEPDCKKQFKHAHYMNRHVKRCHSERREFVCNECGKQYAFISGLKQHMRSHTNEVVWRHCTFCAQKYRTQKSVDIHIRSVHTGERPSVCTVCDSAFFHDDYLKEHMRLHTGETPFKCPICKRGYAQRGNMKSHMKQHRLSELDEATRATMKPNYLRLLRTC